MARSKRDKQVIVNQAYFELIERKAQALDGMIDDGTVSVHAETLKRIDRIVKDWNKIEADDLGGSEPYTEPAEK